MTCLDGRFTGQYRDTETRLDYFNARYYSPAQGRFVSPDPENAGAAVENASTWNGYGYVRNNPLNVTDLSGEGWLTWLGGGLSLIGAFTGQPWLTAIGSVISGGSIGGQIFGSGSPTGGLPSLAGLSGCNGPLGGCGAAIGAGPWNEQYSVASGKGVPNWAIWSASSQRKWVDIGGGWKAGIDQWPGVPSAQEPRFEIHVYEPGNMIDDVGTVRGQQGWIRKHGAETIRRPAGVPERVIERINSLNVEELRRRNILPAKFRSYGYLNAGRFLSILGNGLTLLNLWSELTSDPAEDERSTRRFCSGNPPPAVFVGGFVLPSAQVCRGYRPAY